MTPSDTSGRIVPARDELDEKVDEMEEFGSSNASRVRDGYRVRVFTDVGDFRANQAAEDWVRAEGYSVGTIQRGAPRAIFPGDCDISKWRNLRPEDCAEMAGTMTGDFRNGPITVRLADTSEGKEIPGETISADSARRGPVAPPETGSAEVGEGA